MSASGAQSDYHDLVQRTIPPTPPAKTIENELDALVDTLKRREEQGARDAGSSSQDRIEMLRQLTLTELIPVFVELMEKYATAGVSMEMDASNFLEGGREIRFEFGMSDCRSQLLGTVTTEAIAFHETRYTPDVHGELVSGPMLRLRNLTAETFREFVCERLSIVVRDYSRRR